MKKQKGGIETIIAVILLTGIVVALILAAVQPTVEHGNRLSKDAISRIDELDVKINDAEKGV